MVVQYVLSMKLSGSDMFMSRIATACHMGFWRFPVVPPNLFLLNAVDSPTQSRILRTCSQLSNLSDVQLGWNRINRSTLTDPKAIVYWGF